MKGMHTILEYVDAIGRQEIDQLQWVDHHVVSRSLSHLVARRTFLLPRASPPKILGIVRGLLTNIKSRNLHSIARNY
jgi:hypothetical protein